MRLESDFGSNIAVAYISCIFDKTDMAMAHQIACFAGRIRTMVRPIWRPRSVGKIADIYAQRGISKKVKASGNMALFDAMMTEIDQAPDNSIVFTNLVDFDMEFGHRRDVPGYANALEEFDHRYCRSRL